MTLLEYKLEQFDLICAAAQAEANREEKRKRGKSREKKGVR